MKLEAHTQGVGESSKGASEVVFRPWKQFKTMHVSEAKEELSFKK